MALVTTPASAGTTGVVTDGSGVDFDAMCIAQIPPPGLAVLPPPPPANSYASPGGTGCGAPNSGPTNPPVNGTVSLYDGNTESTDVNTFSLGAGGTDTLTATCQLDSPLPPAGNTTKAHPNAKMPNDALNIFVGVGCKVMFQVPRTQNLTPTVNGGCVRVGNTGVVYDQNDHWKDGAHFFIGYDAGFDGTKWVHSAQIGEYDPAPDGGFFFTELGTASSSTGGSPNFVNAMMPGNSWSATHAGGTVTVTVKTQLVTPSASCVNGEMFEDIAKTGDVIQDVKVLSTADATVTLPVTVPLALLCSLPDPLGDLLCSNNLTSVGGFIFFSDTSEGASTLGSFRTNIKDIAYSGGLIGLTDTLGVGPYCPTPTFGGTLPKNPLTEDPPNGLDLADPELDGCQIDDHMIPGQRGAFLSEWWETPHDFVL